MLIAIDCNLGVQRKNLFPDQVRVILKVLIAVFEYTILVLGIGILIDCALQSGGNPTSWRALLVTLQHTEHASSVSTMCIVSTRCSAIRLRITLTTRLSNHIRRSSLICVDTGLVVPPTGFTTLDSTVLSHHSLSSMLNRLWELW